MKVLFNGRFKSPLGSNPSLPVFIFHRILNVMLQSFVEFLGHLESFITVYSRNIYPMIRKDVHIELLVNEHLINQILIDYVYIFLIQIQYIQR